MMRIMKELLANSFAFFSAHKFTLLVHSHQPCSQSQEAAVFYKKL